jgi:hypothetical protein
MRFTIQGIVHCIGDEYKITEKTSKRQLTLEIDSDWDGQKEYPSFDFTNKNMEKIALSKPGDCVEIDFVLTGRDMVYNGKRYTNIEAKSIRTIAEKDGIAQQDAPIPEPPQASFDTEDIPF